MALNTPSNLGIPASNVEFSESIRPAGKYRAAPWLPVGLFDNRRNEYIVMHGGIPVAGVRPMDKTGRDAGFTDLLPASMLSPALAGDTVITYSATDAALGVINVTTGITAAAGAIVTGAELRAALGLASLATRQDFPIGVLGYRAYRFPGGDGSNANRFNHTNFAVQDQVAILCDYVLELPVEAGTLVTGSAVAVAGDIGPQTISINVNAAPIATAGTWSVYVDDVEVTSDITSITAADPTVVTFAPGYTLAVGQTVKIVATNGAPVAGMTTGAPYFDVGATSTLVDIGQYVKAGAAVGSYAPWVSGTDSPGEIIGQIISVDATLNRGGLDKVKTHYASGDLNTTRLGVNAGLYSMAGSATGGKMGNLYRQLGTTYNGVVRVNLLK